MTASKQKFSYRMGKIIRGLRAEEELAARVTRVRGRALLADSIAWLPLLHAESRLEALWTGSTANPNTDL